jgi:hypothetical protein
MLRNLCITTLLPGASLSEAAHLPLRPCLIPEMKCNYPFLIELFHTVFDASASELTPR